MTEAKKLGKGLVVGNVSCETKDLFNSDIQELAVDLNEMGLYLIQLYEINLIILDNLYYIVEYSDQRFSSIEK